MAMKVTPTKRGNETCTECGLGGLRWAKGAYGSTYLAEGLYKPHRHSRGARRGGFWVAPLSLAQFAGSPQADTGPDGAPGGTDGGTGAAGGDGGGDGGGAGV